MLVLGIPFIHRLLEDVHCYFWVHVCLLCEALELAAKLFLRYLRVDFPRELTEFSEEGLFQYAIEGIVNLLARFEANVFQGTISVYLVGKLVVRVQLLHVSL